MTLQKTILASLLFSSAVSAQTINVPETGFTPTLDGDASEWSSIEGVEVALTNTKPNGKSDVASVTLKGVHKGDMVYFLLQWKDSSNDNTHKPFVWNEEKGKYTAGPQREDRLALQFAMSGDYTSNWMSGNEFVADTWHWKAGRTNPAGLAHDKRTVISKTPSKKAYKATAQDGSDIYIQRPGDSGDKLYTTKRYKEKQESTMPKYILNENATGSIADIKAKGVWKDGMWTLELARKMNTGHDDDVAFSAGQSVKGGIAVFNSSGNEDHNISGDLVFQF